MFDPELSAESAVVAESRIAFEKLRGAIGDAMDGASTDEVTRRAMRDWALVHGWAVLRLHGWAGETDILDD